MSPSPPVVAAGALVTRKVSGQVEVLLVHRPKYDDWSFPKGKLDPHEHETAAAVREVAEETGLDIRLGPGLSPQTYAVGDSVVRPKQVHYWVGRVVGDDDVSGYPPNDEIDEVRWVPVDRARQKLTYPHDVTTLAEAELFRKRSTPLLVLRHSGARSRKSWRGDDRDRPLTKIGEMQAEYLVPVLAAYGVTRLLSSSSRRCWTSLSPYADVADLEIEVTDRLTEEDAAAAAVAEGVTGLLDGNEPAVVCTHRPVLPWVFESLGIDTPPLEPGGMVVVHHRKRRIVAIEHHLPPPGR